MSTQLRSARAKWLFVLCGGLGLGGTFFPGCGTATKSTSADHQAVDRESPLGNALSILRRGPDVEGCREALRLLDLHLRDDPGHDKAIKDGAAGLRKLQQRLGLDDDEVEAISDPAFRPLDAHHLELCLRLRETARSLQLHDLPPLRQAELAFAWVVRQVLLQGSAGEPLLPPQVVLQLGRGTAPDRALLFLALLRELELDGCMIAYAGEDDLHYWIPGVLIGEGDKADVYLFDTRLGIPLPGPGGRGVATLRQLRNQPEKILEQLSTDKAEPYDVSPKQAQKAEVHLVLPLSALAPRFRRLEEVLQEQDRVRLAIDAGALLARFEKAAGGPVKVWNQATPAGQPRPVTPTRVLRVTMPPEEGGVETTQRLAMIRSQMLPLRVVEGRMRALMPVDELPPEARKELNKLVGLLFFKYDIRPREQITRGRLDAANLKLSRIQERLDQGLQAAPPEFPKVMAAWVAKARNAYLAVARNDKRGPDMVEALWLEDQYLLALLDPNEEDAGAAKPFRDGNNAGRHPGLLTILLVKSVEELLTDEARYLQELCLQEKAVRQQTGLEARPKAGAAAREEAQRAWETVKGEAERYLQDYEITPGEVAARLRPVLDVWRQLKGSPDAALTYWDYLFNDWRRAIAVRLMRAEALRQLGETEAAVAALGKLADEVAALRANDKVKAALDECQQRAAGFPAVRAHLEQLVRELGSEGSFYWLGHGIRCRQRLWQQKE